jgi:phosphoglycolate phosphatase-like HAD superfamily hydrolase
MAAIRKVSIYDMDGTIVDSTHRYRTITNEQGIEKIDLQYWRDNEYRAMEDGLLPLADQYMNEIRDPSVYVIIATARVMGSADWQFVNEILGAPDHFISRGANDTRSGGALKIAGLQKFFNLKQFRSIDAVFYEDNTSYLKAVCDHFQIRGVYIPSKQGH